MVGAPLPAVTGFGPMKRFRQAMCNVKTEPVDIMVIGNSITFGLGAGSLDLGWTAQLGDLLAARYGPNAAHGRGWVPVEVYDWTLTNATGLANMSGNSAWGLWGGQLAQSGATQDKVVLIDPIAFDYLTVSAGSFNTIFGGAFPCGEMEIWVDGVLEATIAPRNPVFPDGVVDYGWTEMVGPFPLAVHTLELRIAVTGGLSALFPFGVFAHQGNAFAGVRVWNGGHPSFNISAFTAFQNSQELATAIDPALYIMQETMNDRSVNDATYAVYIASASTMIANAVPNASVLWVPEYESSAYTVAGRFTAEAEILEAQAAADGAGFFPFYELGGLGSLGFNGVATDPCEFLGGGPFHPVDAGHEWIAEMYVALIAGCGCPYPQWCEGVSIPQSVSPSSGSESGGTEVTILGTGLANATSVTFNGVEAASFVVVSDSEITAITADGAGHTGLGDVIVTDDVGAGTLPDAWTYDLVATILASPRQDIYPWSQIDVVPGVIGRTASTTRLSGGMISPSVTAVNNYLLATMFLEAGTYELVVIHHTANDVGIYTVNIDASTEGTFDGYSVGATENVVSTIPGIVIATSGDHEIVLLAATKNAASAGYALNPQELAFTRTAP